MPLEKFQNVSYVSLISRKNCLKKCLMSTISSYIYLYLVNVWILVEAMETVDM